MLAVGCDLLQQPVAFPQVGAGVGLCALGWGEAGGRKAAGDLVWLAHLLGSKCLHGPYTFGHATAQGIVGKGCQLLTGAVDSYTSKVLKIEIAGDAANSPLIHLAPLAHYSVHCFAIYFMRWCLRILAAEK